MIAAALCLVVAISDGDTLKARCTEGDGYRVVTVRLAEIDAPEKSQPFGQRSRASLAALCFGVFADLQTGKMDRYGRTVARVKCRGKDASSEQAKAGMAWFYARYGTDVEISLLETRARAARVGLWIEPAPMAPWDWRAAKRAAHRRQD